MSETTGQAGGTAPLPQLGIVEILRAAFALYRRHWRTLLAVAAVVAVPLTLSSTGSATGSAAAASSSTARSWSRPRSGRW
jgi:hypothetical protein